MRDVGARAGSGWAQGRVWVASGLGQERDHGWVREVSGQGRGRGRELGLVRVKAEQDRRGARVGSGGKQKRGTRLGSGPDMAESALGHGPHLRSILAVSGGPEIRISNSFPLPVPTLPLSPRTFCKSIASLYSHLEVYSFLLCLLLLCLCVS